MCECVCVCVVRLSLIFLTFESKEYGVEEQGVWNVMCVCVLECECCC